MLCRLRYEHACTGWRHDMHGVCIGSVQPCIDGGMPCVRGWVDDGYAGEQWCYRMRGVRVRTFQCLVDGGVCLVCGGSVPRQCGTYCLPCLWCRLDDRHCVRSRGCELHGMRGRSVQRIVGCGVCAMRGRAFSRRSGPGRV